MKLLEFPEVRYGPLPKWDAAAKLLKPRPDLQELEGAMEYLDLHLNRVAESYSILQKKETGFWGFLGRLKAKKEFINTTRALRMIMVFHRENKGVLDQMAKAIKEKLDQDDELALHYSYLLRLLAELESPEAERIVKEEQ